VATVDSSHVWKTGEIMNLPPSLRQLAERPNRKPPVRVKLAIAMCPDRCRRVAITQNGFIA
jgi:hypothetical protein